MDHFNELKVMSRSDQRSGQDNTIASTSSSSTVGPPLSLSATTTDVKYASNNALDVAGQVRDDIDLPGSVFSRIITMLKTCEVSK